MSAAPAIPRIEVRPFVPEDEPEKPSRQGDEEAPGTDPQQRQPVHSLEYPR